MPADSIVSVIIPVFNNWALTEQCLNSLAEHSQGLAYDVIVADNGSTDETAEGLDALGRSLFGGAFRAIRFTENRNFGPACTAAAESAQTPFVFFLNNDTVLTPGWAAPLLEAFARNPKLGAVGPLLLYDNDTVQHLGVVYSGTRLEHLYRHFPASHPVASVQRRVRMLTGAALLVPTALFLDLGGFYEGYRNGFEDVELCLRICDADKRLYCIPQSKIYHLESRTSGRKDADAHNLELLNQRMSASMVTDKHIQGMCDGFVPYIDDSWSVSLRMSDEDERALAERAANRPPEVWMRLTREHPLWVSGRESLAGCLEEEGHRRDPVGFQEEFADTLETESRLRHAVGFRAELADILETVQAYDALARTAGKARMHDIRERAEGRMRELVQTSGNAGRGRFMARAAERASDARLAGLYYDKLRALSGETGASPL